MNESNLSRLARAAMPILCRRPLHHHGYKAHRNRAGHSQEFIDHRNYVCGDDLRAIDWRASARSQHPQVRRYHDEASNHWIICLDRSASMGLWEQKKWNLAVQMAAAWSFLALHSGNGVGLLVFSDAIDLVLPIGRGNIQYRTVLHYLNQIRALDHGRGSNLRTCGSHIKPRSSIVVISDFLAPDGMQTALNHFYKIATSVHLIQILSPNECNLPSAATTTLRDIESDQRIHIDAAGASASAEEQLALLKQNLASYCHAREFMLTSCLADASWFQVLSTHFKRAGIS
jgi:uncharacterized protein (DUF58 family)